MPVLAHPTYTEAAISDVLAQTRPCRLLVVNQGVDTEFRRRLERLAEAHDRLFLWSHQPCLPSLAATWNRALEFAWETGAGEALIVNNDVRLAPNTLELLSRAMDERGALLVTGVGVGKSQFTAGQSLLPELDGRGGPDFSCFLIDRTCHEHYQFDEGFIPAYCEDVDLHRRMLLDGRGGQIFGINVPFLHYGSTTLKTVDEKTRKNIETLTMQVSRAHYHAKWGGEVNAERYLVPFEETSACDGVTTPQLLEEVRHGQADRRAEAR